MEFKKSTKKDIEDIMNIIKQAQEYLKMNNIDQWQNGYPDEDAIYNDITKDISYKITKDNKLIGTAAISFETEETYKKIYEGEWLSNSKYAVIHRIAIDNEYKKFGAATYILHKVEQLCENKKVESIKIDTHEGNLAMQGLLKKNGFEYCGIIYLRDKSKRIAFEKLIKN